MATTSTHTESILEHLFNHFALPVRLPGRQDSMSVKLQCAILDRAIYASRELARLTAGRMHNPWERVRLLLQTCKSANDDGRLSKASLLSAFRQLQDKDTDLLILHVTAQNAGLLMRRYYQVQVESILFEVFESSPVSEKVLESKSPLQWDFPGSAVAIPLAKFNDCSFQDSLANFLERASVESIERFAAHTVKAGFSVSESRDTTNPSLISGCLMMLLEANGTRISPTLLRKRVRDDVCWADGSEKPWRRSAFWLVIRVGIQRHLATAAIVLNGQAHCEVGRLQYKFFMCLLLANLLAESIQSLDPEQLSFLIAKICRRLTKLVNDKEQAPPTIRPMYEDMFSKVEPHLQMLIRAAKASINTKWTIAKGHIQKRIPDLSLRASPADLRLSLTNSYAFIQNTLSEYQKGRSTPQSSVPDKSPEIFRAVPQRAKAFADRYFELSDLELEIERSYEPLGAQHNHLSTRCADIGKKIVAYLEKAELSYSGNSEQQSIMILTVMELWMSMDECAIKLFGLLKSYNPGFGSDIMDVLQLPRFQDMRRLQRLRAYLQDRQKECSPMTIFDSPVEGCFAERYFNDSDMMKDLYWRIEAEADQNWAAKELEWNSQSSEYDEYYRKFTESTCFGYWDGTRRRHDGKCWKCFYFRSMRILEIGIYERPLPSDTVQAKTAVFELACPKAFLKYRDVTWNIISTLALSKPFESHSLPGVLLENFVALKPYIAHTSHRFTLASKTKPHLVTHYVCKDFPAALSDVCRPNHLTLDYFDDSLKLWPGRQKTKLTPTFAHRCQFSVPINSPFASFINSAPEFAADADGPSSYQVISGQTKCPSDLNVHEFTAFQALFSGKARRWQQILRELASANLNFSSAATTSLISFLTLQVGPAHNDDPFGLVHRPFQSELFCQRLVEQLGQRLDAIASNWRETHCLDTMITLILRLCALGTSFHDRGVKLLDRARSIALGWAVALRSEIQLAKTVTLTKRYSDYALWAALLCRRTFAAVEDDSELEPAALHAFIQCSITRQDNSVADPDSASSMLKSALIRDLKLVRRIGNVLRRSLEANPKSLVLAIAAVCPGLKDCATRPLSEVGFLQGSHRWWFQVIIEATQQTLPQTIHFHLLEGNLLVMGKPIGKLPAEYSDSSIFKDLFGNLSLPTFPSPLRGMSYRLAFDESGHEVHLGFRDGDLIVRTCRSNIVQELIHRDKLRCQDHSDLPSSLVENCFHWLNLRTGVIEIRQRHHIWKPRAKNWRLNLQNRRGWRKARKNYTLIDAQSRLFDLIAGIFDGFEDRQHLMIFQTTTGNLCVHLHRLELAFFVNSA